ncbi:hypothetical protein ACTTZI_004206 [Vibrio vulnificus]
MKRAALVGTLITIWFSLMSLTIYKFSTIPQLKSPKSITEQIEHYSPYSELAVALMLVALIAIISAGLRQELNLKSKREI